MKNITTFIFTTIAASGTYLIDWEAPVGGNLVHSRVLLQHQIFDNNKSVLIAKVVQQGSCLKIPL